MSGFEPGEGWREVTDTSDMDKAVLVNYEDPKSRGWVREAPVPPLPTEPYTVIRVTWRSDSARPALGDLGIRTLFPAGTWTGWAVENLLERISGFEVLAEPRAVTAKAVLGRLIERLREGRIRADGLFENIDGVGREFGVQS